MEIVEKEKRQMYGSSVTDRCGDLIVNDYPEGTLKGKYEFLDHDVLLIRDFIPFAKELIETADRLNLYGASPLIRGNASQYYDNSMRNNTKCDLRGSLHPDFARFERLMIHVAHASVKLYMMDNTFITLVRDEGFQILKYDVNQHFKPHIDAIMGRTTPEGNRAVSLVAYLNDDYGGGELCFPRQGLTIKPETGSVVVFPSYFTHVHESQDITQGVKYSVVTWFQ